MPPPHALFVGLATLDTAYRVATLPGPNAKVTAASQELAAGGPAANAAVAHAALGGHATLLTSLGRHVLARYAAAELADRRVLVRDAAPAGEHAPAVSSVYVEERTGDRSVVSVNGAAHAPVPPPGLGLDGASVVLVDGHHPELALAAAGLARRHGVPVVLDGGSWKPVLAALLPLVDVAICSADFRAPGAVTSDASAADLRARGVPAVAVTRGGEPVRWWVAAEAGEVAVPRIRAVDTLGAGDTFHGAFCYALAAAPRRALAAQLRFAAEVAAVRCGVVGLRAWLAEPAVRELAAAWGSVDDRS